MRDDRPTLVSPDPADLSLLFEASRLLGRHTVLEEAMGPLLSLLSDRGALSGGVAALALSDDGEVRVAAVVDPADAALAGKRVDLDGGILGKALSSASPAFGDESLAVPIVLGGNAAGALYFTRLHGSRDRAFSLASSVAALVAEALGLRRRLARAAALGDSASGHVVLQTAEPLRADEGWAPAAIVGRSAPMRELYSMMDRVAGTETTILIPGESGNVRETRELQAIKHDLERIHEELAARLTAEFRAEGATRVREAAGGADWLYRGILAELAGRDGNRHVVEGLVGRGVIDEAGAKRLIALSPKERAQELAKLSF